MSCGRSNLTSFSQSSLKMICFGLGISHPAQCIHVRFAVTRFWMFFVFFFVIAVTNILDFKIRTKWVGFFQMMNIQKHQPCPYEIL